MKSSIVVLWLLCCLQAMAGSKRDEQLVVQFNIQGSETDGKKISVPQQVAGETVYFRLTPDISTRDIDSFRPFPADDGYSYGVLLRLNRAGAQRLVNLTDANPGKLLLARINGRALDVVKIDKGIRDGQLVIWQGITTREIGLADQMMPRIGQTRQEWKREKKKRK